MLAPIVPSPINPTSIASSGRQAPDLPSLKCVPIIDRASFSRKRACSAVAVMETPRPPLM